MNDRETDALARRRTWEEFQRPLVLEAGAGTGKTAALTCRLLSWVVGPGWGKTVARRPGAPPEEVAAGTLRRVLAITFTEAAAAEMTERVAEALEALAAGERPDWLSLPPDLDVGEVAERAGHLSGALDHLNVSTIHSYCLALLRQESVAAGLHPAFQVDAEGNQVREAIRQELVSWLPEAAASSAVARLVGAGHSLADLADALFLLVAAGIEPGELTLAGAEDRWRRELEQARSALVALQAASAALGGLSRRHTRTIQTWRAVKETANILENLSTDDFSAVMEQLVTRWPARCRDRLSAWSKDEWGSTELQALGERRGEVAALAAVANDALESLLAAPLAELAAAAAVLAELLERVRQRLRRQGWITFEGLVLSAERLLASWPEGLARERARWEQVLVDEFQDTDYRQCRLLAHLCLEGPPQARPGLFVVGDPKQSIFGWRNADLAAYEEFIARIRDEGGEVYPLCVNFRSVPAILEEVERAVAPVMQAEPGIQPAFQRLLPCPARQGKEGFREGRWAPVEYWEAPSGSSSERSALMARAVAADVAELGRRGVAWRRVAILMRTTTELETYLEAFREAGVPYSASRERSYYRRREVIEAAALLRVLVDPSDQVALLAWLRSSLVGVPDAALLSLWRVGLPGLLSELRDPEDQRIEALREDVAQLAATLPAKVPGLERVHGWDSLLLAGVRQVAELRCWLEREPFPHWLERVRRSTWVEAGAAARYLGRFRLANLEAFFARLEQQVEKAGGDSRAVVWALRRTLAERQPPESRRPVLGAVDGVAVMTIHGAKGLDFDHVYLVEAHRGSRREGGDHQVVRVGSMVFLRLLGYSWPGWQVGATVRRGVERAELVRTLYVALTRAKERLVVVGDWQGRGASGETYLGLLRHRRPELGWGEALQDSDGWRWLEAGGVRWVRPPALAPPGEQRRPLVAGEVFDARALAAEAKRLVALARKSAERAARPLGGTVTAEVHRYGDKDHRPRQGLSGEASAAAAVGTAVHAVLERVELGEPLTPQLMRWAQNVERLLPRDLPPHLREASASRARAVLTGITASRWCRRLEAVSAAVVGREVPIMLPLREDGDGPIGYLSGVIDLLYRDEVSGELVVADFKTDAASSDSEVALLVERYRIQGELYCRAVQEALGLPNPPHWELWFLQAGRIVRIW